MPHLPVVTKSQANRAGREFRKVAQRYGEAHKAGDEEAQQEVWLEARSCIATISAYRLLHEYPLRKVTMGVRMMALTVLGDGAPRPSQRFKRMERIVDKLLRYPSMALSTMQDIGGCRLVLDDLDELRRVERHIARSKRWRSSRIEDYIVEPKPDGYRAVHIIAERDNRWIEVQLRTRLQEQWATAVEEAEAQTGYDVKDGIGPDDLLLYFKLAALRLALEDQGAPADPRMQERFQGLRTEIRHYYASE